jgi:hypothetical protein
MRSSLRKFVIGGAVLAVLLASYRLYSRLGGTGPVGVAVPELLPPVVEAGTREPNRASGRLGGTEIGPVEKTRFFHRDQNSRVDRVFGFEELVPKQGEFVFVRPFMKLFLPRFQCHVIADTAQVQLETALGQVIPNDATFHGNVVIHVVPPEPNDPRECFIYLDDVAFIADKSLFSSSGPVRFVSRSAVLEGTGMQLIYDGAVGRLELFRIMHLGSARTRSADMAMFSRRGKEAKSGTQAATPSGQGSRGPAGGADPNGARGDYYECVLRRNVMIDSPQGVVMAEELFTIDDIFWPRSAESKPAAGRAPGASPEPNEPEAPLAPDILDSPASRRLAFDAMPMESFDIVVTCDGGLVVTPKGASARFTDPNTAAPSGVPAGRVPHADTASPDRQHGVARRIAYNWTTHDAVCTGPLQMTLFLDPNVLSPGPLAGSLSASPGTSSAEAAVAETRVERRARLSRSQTQGPPMPMTVSARDMARFLSASQQVVLEGDCTATVEKTDPNVTYLFTMSAPTMTLDLARDPNVQPIEKAITLKRFATGGGPAEVTIRRSAGEQLLGWTKLLASELDYDAGARLFSAHGPGQLQVRNDQVPGRATGAPTAGSDSTESKSAGGGTAGAAKTDASLFSFDRPCYAFLRDFDLLTFASDTRRIVVAADQRPILLDYFPLIDGKYDQPVQADAGRLEMTLQQTPDSRTEIASLVASQGITYEDKTRKFAGNILTYGREQSLVKVTGDRNHPCYFNGALVNQIEMNVKTGAAKTQLQAPTILQGQR